MVKSVVLSGVGNLSGGGNQSYFIGNNSYYIWACNNCLSSVTDYGTGFEPVIVVVVRAFIIWTESNMMKQDIYFSWCYDHRI